MKEEMFRIYRRKREREDRLVVKAKIESRHGVAREKSCAVLNKRKESHVKNETAEDKSHSVLILLGPPSFCGEREKSNGAMKSMLTRGTYFRSEYLNIKTMYNLPRA